MNTVMPISLKPFGRPNWLTQLSIFGEFGSENKGPTKLDTLFRRVQNSSKQFARLAVSESLRKENGERDRETLCV